MRSSGSLHSLLGPNVVYITNGRIPCFPLAETRQNENLSHLPSILAEVTGKRTGRFSGWISNLSDEKPPSFPQVLLSLLLDSRPHCFTERKHRRNVQLFRPAIQL